MSDERKDGGPAFPASAYETEHGDTVVPAFPEPGMSLRDWFAGQALLRVHASDGRYGPGGLAQVAEYSYAMADAMLAERDRK